MGRPTMPPLDTSLSRLQGAAAAAAGCLAGTPPLTAQAQHVPSSVRGCRLWVGGHDDESVPHRGISRYINSNWVHRPLSFCSQKHCPSLDLRHLHTLCEFGLALAGYHRVGNIMFGSRGITLSSMRQWCFVVAPLMRRRHRLPLCAALHRSWSSPFSS